MPAASLRPREKSPVAGAEISRSRSQWQKNGPFFFEHPDALYNLVILQGARQEKNPPPR